VLVQLYGTTTVEDARALDALGPDHLGIVVEEGYETWDAVDLDTARTIAAALTTTKLVVASLHSQADGVLETVQGIRPAIVHLARAADMDDAVFERIRTEAAPVEVMATVPVLDASSVAFATRLARYADYLLLDSKDLATGAVGATGLAHDWSISAEIVQAVDVPVILAGGLGPDNVAAAIERVRPAGVDSETQTSRLDDRRRKDLVRVEAFITAARSAAN
jgi:phosphoribosylanthranilate isomerase